MRIDQKKIVRLIETQLNEILYNGDCDYRGYFITVAEEQDFNRIQDKHRNHIYVVVKFLPASFNYSQIMLPISINVISEDRKLDVCKKLLLEYVEDNNLKLSDESTVQQFYSSPQVLSNFEEIYDGFRSLMYLSGTFLINESSDPKKFYNINIVEKYGELVNFDINHKNFFKFINDNGLSYKVTHHFRYNSQTREITYTNSSSPNVDNPNEPWSINIPIENVRYELGIVFKEELTSDFVFELDFEEIEVLNYNTTCDVMLDTQPFYNSNNFGVSIGKVGTYLLNLTCYANNTPFLNKVSAIADEDLEIAPDNVDSTFFVAIEKIRSKNIVIKKFKLASMSDQGSIGEFPVVAIVLSK